MGGEFAGVLIALLWAGFLWWAGYHEMRVHDREVKGVQERYRVQALEERANTQLWELLHESDPDFLALLGIEEPEALRRNREMREQAAKKAPVRQGYSPGDVVLVNPKPARAPQLDVQSLLANAAIDRSVEAKLEAQLARLGQMDRAIHEEQMRLARQQQKVSTSMLGAALGNLGRIM